MSVRGDDARFDPGWLWVIAGLTVISACLVIPAQDDLREAENELSRARALESHAGERLNRYTALSSAVRDPDESMVRTLAAVQLNIVPAGTRMVTDGISMASRSASLLAQAEPRFESAHVRGSPDSLLARLISSPAGRLWVMALGTAALVYGLMPMTALEERVDEADEGGIS